MKSKKAQKKVERAANKLRLVHAAGDEAAIRKAQGRLEAALNRRDLVAKTAALVSEASAEVGLVAVAGLPVRFVSPPSSYTKLAKEIGDSDRRRVGLKK